MPEDLTAPVVAVLAEDQVGARPYRLDPLRPAGGWAILSGQQVWIWAGGLRPLQPAGYTDPYTYEVWAAGRDGQTTSLGATGPAPGGLALATFHLPDPAQVAAVLVTAQPRGHQRPSAVVLTGCLRRPDATAPAAGQAPAAQTGLAAAPAPAVADPEPALAAFPIVPAAETFPTVPAPAAFPAVPPATGVFPGLPDRLEPALPAHPSAAAACPDQAPCAPPDHRADAPAPPDTQPETAHAPARDLSTTNGVPTAPFSADPSQYSASAPLVPVGGAEQIAPTAPAPAVTPAMAPPPPQPLPPAAPLAAAPPLVAPPADPPSVKPAAAPGNAPPGCVPLETASILLEPHGPAAPAGTATAQLDFSQGALLMTARNLPRPEDFGESAHTGRNYNTYRVWLQSSSTHETLCAGMANRVWEGTYRTQIRDGLQLRRYDTLLVTVEDRAGSAGHPSGTLILSGRYRWYQPQA